MPSSGAERNHAPGAWLRQIALGCALIAFGFHGANLLYRAQSVGCDSSLLLCRTEVGAWATGDFPTFIGVADAIRDRGVLGASYFQRTPGYPLLLFSARAASGEVSPLRWLGPVSAAAAAAAAVWLTARARGRVGPAVCCGLLIALWPNGFRFTSALRPDGSHAFLALAALAASCAYERSARRRDGVFAALLWIAVQSLRPTFFGVGAALLPLFAHALRDPARRRGALALLAATLLVPAFVVGHNGWRHAAWVPTDVGDTNLACYAVPRLQHELGLGPFPVMRALCELHFDAMPPSQRGAAQRAYAFSVFREYPVETAASFALEIITQLDQPASPSRHADLYPSWLALGSTAIWAYWWLALVGLLRIAQRDAPLALTLGLLAALVMVPAASSHLVGPRLRLPVDLLAAFPVSVALLDLGELFARSLSRLRRPPATKGANPPQGLP